MTDIAHQKLEPGEAAFAYLAYIGHVRDAHGSYKSVVELLNQTWQRNRTEEDVISLVRHINGNNLSLKDFLG